MLNRSAPSAQSAPDVLARVPVARGRAMQRAVLRVGPAVLLAIVIGLKYQQLDFQPSAVTNRIIEYSWAVLLLAGAGVVLVLAITGVRWLLLAAWPAGLQIVGTQQSLDLHLGPMGVRSYDVQRLRVRYLFELPHMSDEMPFESLLDEAQQMAELLPQIMHPAAPRRLDRIIILYAAGPESAIAARLRPFIEHCRIINPAAAKPSPDEEVPTERAITPAAAPTFKVPRSYLRRPGPATPGGEGVDPGPKP